MALTSLLVCADAGTVQVLSRVLEDLGITVESCSDSDRARPRIKEQSFNAVIVDYVDETAAELVTYARETSSNQSMVIVVMVNGGDAVTDIFSKGANFALYKPISQERAAHSIRAARGLIRQERRIQPRVPVQSRASIAYPGKEDARATLVDLNDSGLGVRAEDRLPPSCKVYFQFSLPQNDSVVRLAGEVMWQDASGRVGIRFAQIPQGSRKVLQSWVQANSFPETGVESETPRLQPDELSVGLTAGLGLLTVSAADRRKLERQACRLGAEVYRVASRAPIRCTLSDISAAGCYVEASESLPVGTALEIVVRTRDLRFCLAGTVHSAHPGFGMGVRFSLRNEEQKKQVQQLILCAGAEAKVNE
ncbi:MAG: PilZ domain-containing protein [Terriglobales bacterium]